MAAAVDSKPAQHPPHWTDKLQTFDRRWIFLAMSLAIVLPLFFPLNLPARPDQVMEEGGAVAVKFLRFVPPGRLDHLADGSAVLPHIRLDRALDYLLGDWLR